MFGVTNQKCSIMKLTCPQICYVCYLDMTQNMFLLNSYKGPCSYAYRCIYIVTNVGYDVDSHGYLYDVN